MLSRRGFLATTALLPLGLCNGLPPVPGKVPAGTIDIHAHIFNGRDVPAAGFVEQVVLRDPDEPVEPGGNALIRLLALILFSGTPSAGDELRALTRREAVATTAPPTADLAAQDEANVAAALAQFEAARTRRAATAEASEDSALMRRLYEEAGLAAPDLRIAATDAARQTEARRLAREIYRRDERTDEYLNPSNLFQTLRWAGLLTRRRSDILAELLRLYGGEEKIRVFSPSIVDFQFWLPPEPLLSPLEDQIAVMAEIARRTTDAVILNFVPFCPRRAVRTTGRHPLDIVKRAVNEQGFAGVKLYPPIGFRPHGNEDLLPEGADYDRELHRLYQWCLDNDVPIKAHANNSIPAQPCSGLFASPANWQPVLEEFRGLRLNLAHFGGFEETAMSQRVCRPGPPDWEDLIADMLAEHENLYFDTGHWTEIADPKSPERERVRELTEALLARQPLAKKRMMYGSDWSMIGRLPRHNHYLAEILSEFGMLLEGDGDAVADVMGGNARRFLGLDGDTERRRRLAGFFGPGHPFNEVFPA